MKRKARASPTIPPVQRAQAFKQSSNDDVNWLNVGLMVLACGLAIAAPFQVFLFAYAVLGPLHYLTEISWLHDRKYFTRQPRARQWWLALVLFSILVLALTYAGTDAANNTPTNRTTIVFGTALISLVFAGAAAAIYVQDWRKGVGLLAILAAGLAFFSGYRAFAWAVLAVTLLTTIVHVFVFTGAFILLGALKSRSKVGILSLVVFIACAILAITVAAPFAAPTPHVRQLYLSFELLNRALLLLFGHSRGASPGVYESAGVGVMRLIAFAYLYHYLNWFSKTSIIKWHEVSRSRAVTIFGLWLLGGAIYLYDYRIGLGIFYILSMLHVFLEFPLNHQTFVDIGKSVSRWGTSASPRGTPDLVAATTVSRHKN
jgi:VanZ family protein